jgi:hypothetical protein
VRKLCIAFIHSGRNLIDVIVFLAERIEDVRQYVDVILQIGVFISSIRKNNRDSTIYRYAGNDPDVLGR